MSDIEVTSEKDLAIAVLKGALLGHDLNGKLLGNFQIAGLTPEELVKFYRVRTLTALRYLGGLSDKKWADELDNRG